MRVRNSSTYTRIMASVGRRLFVLVACQTMIALVLVLMGVHAISRAADDYRHMYNFQFKPVVAIGEAMGEAGTLRPGAKSRALDSFDQRYRTEWEKAAGTTPDAT